jgi:hypothetical protein
MKQFENGGLSFYISNDIFDSIPISVTFSLRSESCSLKCRLEVDCAIKEKHGSFSIVFFSEFSEKDFGEGCRCNLKQPQVEYSDVTSSSLDC